MKKGISLVALVITIIVLIILTAAVIWSSGDTPEQAKLAVFYNDISVIQEALNTKILTNYVDAAISSDGDTSELGKWGEIVNVTGAALTNTNLTAAITEVTSNSDIELRPFYKNAGVKLGIGLDDNKMSEFVVDVKSGIVYYANGISFNDAGTIAYNRQVQVTANSTNSADATKVAAYSIGKNYGNGNTLASYTVSTTSEVSE